MTENNARVVLLDIEGTTTPIDFVYHTLFPFARKHLEVFLQTHIHVSDVLDDIAALRDEHKSDIEQSLNPPPWSVSDEKSAALYALWLMDQDRKSTALKSLQGRVWEAGYVGGELHGLVFDDVPRALRRWKDEGRRIAIYSSGSILAQKLIFGYSSAGDLTPMIDAYFDTTTGQKKEVDSYRKIAATMGVEPREALFYSDVIAELDAARDAGMQTTLCVRDGETSDPGDHPVVSSFDRV